MSNFIVPMGSLPTVQGIGGTGTTQPAQGTSEGGVPFSDFLKDAMQDVAATSVTAQDTMLSLALGNSDDLHTGAIAGVKASTAVSYTASLVNTAIRAYNELMRMQL